jgi:hypothetical protein
MFELHNCVGWVGGGGSPDSPGRERRPPALVTESLGTVSRPMAMLRWYLLAHETGADEWQRDPVGTIRVFRSAATSQATERVFVRTNVRVPKPAVPARLAKRGFGNVLGVINQRRRTLRIPSGATWLANSHRTSRLTSLPAVQHGIARGSNGDPREGQANLCRDKRSRELPPQGNENQEPDACRPGDPPVDGARCVSDHRQSVERIRDRDSCDERRPQCAQERSGIEGCRGRPADNRTYKQADRTPRLEAIAEATKLGDEGVAEDEANKADRAEASSG